MTTECGFGNKLTAYFNLSPVKQFMCPIRCMIVQTDILNFC